MPKLDSQVVHDMFMDCLFHDGEPTTSYIPAEGIMTIVGFHPDRLAKYTSEIVAFLTELPVPFMEKQGGGWSFLQACEDKNGHMWTGEHRVMEMLFQLGIAIGKVKALFPRDMWDALPGGMPYYVVME